MNRGVDVAQSVAAEAVERDRESIKNSDIEAAHPELDQGIGVTKIEALYYVFGNGWRLWLLWGAIAVIAYVYSLSQATTWTYAMFATSAYGQHTVVATISVVTMITAGVAQPFIAKVADLTSRPFAIGVSVLFYTIGYIAVAASSNIRDVVGGQVIYTIGQTGIQRAQAILIGDITSLQWRGMASALYSLPWVPNAFIAGLISDGVNAFSSDGWRWGYGMFCIMIPVCFAPLLLILFWGDYRAKKLGALSIASSQYARRQVLEGMGEGERKRTLWESCQHYWTEIDAFGLLLLGFAFAGLLAPFTLQTTAKGGLKNPSLIALLTVGGVLFISFLIWEWRFASHPIMPKRVMNRTMLCCIAIDFLYYFSGYLTDSYYMSWVFVTKSNWSTKQYSNFSNIMTVGLCGFSVFTGLAMRYTHRYKWLQLTGLSIRVIGEGLRVAGFVTNPSGMLLIWNRILISLGGSCTVITTQVASQGSMSHGDMAIGMAVLSLWTDLGGSIASAISGSIWNTRVPAKIAAYVPAAVNATEQATLFGSIVEARASPHRMAVVRAQTETLRPLAIAGLVISILALVAGILTPEIKLGKAHNVLEPHKEIEFRAKEDTTDEAIRAKVQEAEERARRQVEQEKASA